MGRMKQKFIEQQNEQAEERQDAINHLYDAYNILKNIDETIALDVNKIKIQLESEMPLELEATPTPDIPVDTFICRCCGNTQREVYECYKILGACFKCCLCEDCDKRRNQL